MRIKKSSYMISIVVLLQLLFFTTWYYMEHSKLSDPKSNDVVFRVIPVDPRDFLSGNYFTLSYKFSNKLPYRKRVLKHRNHSYYLRNGDYYISLVKKKGWKYYKADTIYDHIPKKIQNNHILIKCKYERMSCKFGIEKYFINENTMEPNPKKDKIEVLVTIDKDYSVRIKKLYVNDEEFDQSKHQRKDGDS